MDENTFDFSIYPSVDMASQIFTVAADDALDKEFDRLFNEPITLPSFISQPLLDPVFDDDQGLEQIKQDSFGYSSPEIAIAASNNRPFPPMSNTNTPKRQIPLPQLAQDEDCEYDRSFQKTASSGSGSPEHKSIFIDATILNENNNFDTLENNHQDQRHRQVSYGSPGHSTKDPETAALLHELQEQVRELREQKNDAIEQLKSQSSWNHGDFQAGPAVPSNPPFSSASAAPIDSQLFVSAVANPNLPSAPPLSQHHEDKRQQQQHHHHHIQEYEEQKKKKLQADEDFQVNIEVLRLRNTVTTLESKIAVLERKLEYSQFMVKIAEEERVKVLKKSHYLESELQELKLKQSTTIREHDEYRAMTEKDFHFKQDTNENSPFSNNRSEKNKKDFPIWKSVSTTQKFSADQVRKQALKDELKQKILSSSMMERGRSMQRRRIEKERVRTDDALFTESALPFVVGKAAPSFSLPANIQKVRALLKNSSSSTVRSKSRSRSATRKHDKKETRGLPLNVRLKEAEHEYQQLNMKYNGILERYKAIPYSLEFQAEREHLSKTLRTIIHEMESKMKDVTRLSSLQSHVGDGDFSPSSSNPQTTFSRSPSRAFHNLCALKSAQKMQEKLKQEENVAFSNIFGGSLY